MERSAIDSIISQIRVAQATASGGLAVKRAPEPGAGAGFSQVLSASVERVNESQLKAREMAQAYELGANDVNLHNVMVQMAKANISFQTMIQVRNRLVSAYHEMMNMQV